MDLFLITKEGTIVFASGEKPSKSQLVKITKACALTLADQILIPKEKKVTEKLSQQFRKDQFYAALINWKNKNLNKYPSPLYDKFFNYWIQSDDLGTSDEMRFEKVRRENGIFNIGGRLSTFAQKAKESGDLNKYWDEHHKQEQKQQLF
jgi:hypothetical protein